MITHTCRIMFLLAVSVTWLLAPDRAVAQDPPAILTQATGQVAIQPDHAVLGVGAAFRAERATDASSQLTAALRAILDTLTALGFDPDSLPTTQFSIAPQMDYQANAVIGYEARAQVTVTIRDLDLVGTVVDAVVAAGANQLGSLGFGVEDQRAARDSALALAVADARRDADVLARAAGGQIGGLIQLSTASGAGVGGRLALNEIMVRGASSQQVGAVPVTPQAVMVRVNITARWLFTRR